MKTEWKKCKLGEVASFQNGFAFKSHDFKSKGKYHIIRIKELKNGLVRFFDDTVKIQNIETYVEKKFLANKNDILFALTGDPINKNNPLSWVGRVAKYTYNDLALLNQRVAKLIPSETVDKDFVYYHFRCFDNFYSLASKATGSASQANISTKTIENEEIFLPPLPIQKKITGILKSLDDKIELNRQISKNLEEQARCLFDKTFPDSHKGKNKISDYILPQKGKNLQSKDAVPGSVPVVAGGLNPTTYHNVANTSAPVITISASGANAGYVKLWNIPVWSSDSSYIDNSVTTSVYFWYILLKKRQNEIFDAQTGSAQPHIYPSHIGNMPMCSVSQEKMEKFHIQVTPLFELIGKNILENQKLSSLRDTLLPKLMNGEIEVSDMKC